MLGKIITYKGTNYRVKEETKTALCLGSNYLQQVWVTKDWIRENEFKCLVGRVPASLLLM